MKYLILLLLAGCTNLHSTTNIDPHWPKDMQVYEVVVAPGKIWELCPGSFLGLPLACYVVNVCKHICWAIYTDTTPESTRQNERDHCHGALHPGETRPASAWIKSPDCEKKHAIKNTQAG